MKEEKLAENEKGKEGMGKEAKERKKANREDKRLQPNGDG